MPQSPQNISASCADLIRASISLEKMDFRVKPGNDQADFHAREITP